MLSLIPLGEGQLARRHITSPHPALLSQSSLPSP
jgi:hypothetical protein